MSSTSSSSVALSSLSDLSHYYNWKHNKVSCDIVAVVPNTKPSIVKNIFKRNNNESKERKVNTPKQAFLQQPGAMQGSLIQHNNFARMSIKNHI